MDIKCKLSNLITAIKSIVFAEFTELSLHTIVVPMLQEQTQLVTRTVTSAEFRETNWESYITILVISRRCRDLLMRLSIFAFPTLWSKPHTLNEETTKIFRQQLLSEKYLYILNYIITFSTCIK